LSERDEHGRFLRGNSEGRGRPFRQRETAYYDAVKTTVSLPKWKKAVRTMLDLAISGDCKAFNALAKLLLPADSTLLELVQRLGEAIEKL
jgi:hypothetical protein